MKNCKWCKMPYPYDEMTTRGHNISFCSEECCEQYFLNYRCGFVPKKYVNEPQSFKYADLFNYQKEGMLDK